MLNTFIMTLKKDTAPASLYVTEAVVKMDLAIDRLAAARQVSLFQTDYLE